MISNRKILLAALIVFNLALIVAAFIAAGSYGGAFWTGVVFDLIGAFGVGYFTLFAYDRNRDSPRDVPQNLAVVYGAGLYWILQLLFSIPAICFDWSVRYVLSAHLVLFGVFLAGVALLLIGRNYITATESRESSTARNISRQRHRVAAMERLSLKYPDDRQLADALEKIRYSDPCFLPELDELEQKIDRLITEIAAPSSGSRAAGLETLNELIDERNIEIRSRK